MGFGFPVCKPQFLVAFFFIFFFIAIIFSFFTFASLSRPIGINSANSHPISLHRRRMNMHSSVERELMMARVAIRLADSPRGNGSVSLLPLGETTSVYRNPAAFSRQQKRRRNRARMVTGMAHLQLTFSEWRRRGMMFRSYSEMEKRFKVYVYEEGDAPLVHMGPCKNIYTTEGRFISELEMMRPDRTGSSSMRTFDPNRAHAFFLPFSVAMTVKYVFDRNTKDQTPVGRFVSDYVRTVAALHPFWNRTSGADHFIVACHDWGPYASKFIPELYNKSIRALCNANTSEGFVPRKDVSIPEIHLLTGEISPALRNPPKASQPRPHLAFFAGGLHGPVRPLLIQQWQGRDADILVYEYLPNKTSDFYLSMMLHSKFCLCPSGYEVASPRVVEAIYAECVPVLISEGYVPPLSDVLRWEEFSVSVDVGDIPKLKDVLMKVAGDEGRMEKLRRGMRAVRRHFVLNHPPERFDAFHMIMHSVWLRRLNVYLGR